MKKTIFIVMLLFAFCVNAFAAPTFEKVPMVPEKENDKVITLTEDPHSSGELIVAYYGNNMYLAYDRIYQDVPFNKKSNGFTNSPMYVYDANLNLIKTIEYETDRFITKFYDGYFYIWEQTYPAYQKVEYTYYKTTDGETLTEISREEYNDVMSIRYLYNGMMYDKDGAVETLKQNDKTYRIRHGLNEDIAFVQRGIYSSTDFSVLYFLVRNDPYDIYCQETHEEISLDGVSRVTLPEDASFTHTWNDETYLYIPIEFDTEYCYRIAMNTWDSFIKVICNDEYLAFDTLPMIENNYTLVPMRFLFEQFGAEVVWDQDSKTATVHRNDDSIAFSIDSTQALVNGEVIEMDVPARLIDGRTLVPLRFLSEHLGYTVEWDADTRTATVTE